MKCVDCGHSFVYVEREHIFVCQGCGVILDEDGKCLSGVYGEVNKNE